VPRLPGLALALALAGLAAPALAAPAGETRSFGVRLAGVGRFHALTDVTAPPGDTHRVFAVEQRGTIRILRDGRKLGTPFLDLRRRVSCCDERGLLSMAFAPDYATSGLFYVYFTDRRGDIRVEEYRRSPASPDLALPSTRRLVLRQRHPDVRHNGGGMVFGPDGMLYLGLGDGGPEGDPLGRGQSLRTLLGKILRIDPRHGRRYLVPASNPLVHRRGARKEIWAYGLRNPWRFSFTPKGSLVLGDVGQDRFEEIDYVPTSQAGRPPRGGYNFGWSVFEGRHRFRAGRAPHHVPPVIERSHTSGFCAIVGGFVVRDPALLRLRGRYVYGDLCHSELEVARLRRGRSHPVALGLRLHGVTTFGEDVRGRLYVGSSSGRLYRLAPR
jgi:glucose/arabinose dehydrogenase